MTIDMLIASILLFLMTVFYVYNLIRHCQRACKDRGFMYALKIVIGKMQLVGGFVVSMYIAILGAYILPEFMQFWDKAFQLDNPQGDFIYGTMPLFVIFLIVVLMILSIIISDRWWLWGLTDEEKSYEKAERIKRKELFRENLDKYPKWIRWVLSH